jgi:hypothetical protein
MLDKKLLYHLSHSANPKCTLLSLTPNLIYWLKIWGLGASISNNIQRGFCTDIWSTELKNYFNNTHQDSVTLFGSV